MQQLTREHPAVEVLDGDTEPHAQQLTQERKPARKAEDRITASGPPASAPAKPTNWFVSSANKKMSLRIVSGAILCEGFDGEVVLSVDEAAHAARFDIIDEELWLNCLAGYVAADGQAIHNPVRVVPGTRLTIGTTAFRVSDSLEDAPAPVPILVNRSETAPRVAGSETVRVFYEEPPEEIEFTQALARPHLLANRTLTAEVAAASTPAALSDEILLSIPVADSPSGKRVPRYRDARSRAKTGLRATTLLIAALFAATGYFALQIFEQNQSWWAQQSWFAKPSVNDGTGDGTGNETATERKLASGVKTIELLSERPETTLRSRPDPGETALAQLTWLEEISGANNDRILALASQLLATEHRDQTLEHLQHYATRLVEVDDVALLEQLTIQFGSLLGDEALLQASIVSLEQRIQSLGQRNRDIAALNEQAEQYWQQGALTLPPKNNVVAIATQMKRVYSDSDQARSWFNKAANAMVDDAESALLRGDAYAARGLLEDVKAFYPGHRRMRQMLADLDG